MVFCLGIACPSFCFSSATEEHLAVGEQRSIAIEAQTRYSVGNPEVIQVKTTQLSGGKSLLLVKAKHQGYSDLVLITSSGKQKQIFYRVGAKQEASLGRDIKNSLSNTKGIEVSPKGRQWFVQGEVKRIEDYNVLRTLADKSNVQNFARLHVLSRRLAEKDIQALLDRAGLKDVHVRGAGSQIWLEGNVDSKASKELAESLGKEIFPSLRSYLRVPFSPTEILRFKVHILELAKTKQNSTGFNWSEAIPDILQIQQKLFKTAFSLKASLALLSRKGLVRVLSEPEIVLNEEGLAELKVGGEVPISLKSKFFAQVQWKPYGLGLKIEVPGVYRNVIRTKVEVEVSALDHSNAADGIPAIKTNRMQTIVDLNINRTLFLSGLIQESNGETISAIPILGDIPILGELFRSKSFQENKSELVMAITPVRE